MRALNASLIIIAAIWLFLPCRTAHAGEKQLNELNAAVVRLVAAGKHKEATAAAESAVTAIENELGHEHPVLASALNNLAEVYGNSVDRRRDVERLHLRALKIREGAPDRFQLDLATSLSNLGRFYIDTHRYNEAEPLLRRAVSIREHRLGSNHILVANSLYHLGSVYSEMQRYDEKEALLRRVLRIRTRVLGDRHQLVGFAWGSLGSVLMQLERFSEAESAIGMSMKIAEVASGEQSADAANARELMGELLLRRRQYREAEKHFSFVLDSHKRIFGWRSPNVASKLNNLGRLYLEDGRYALATSAFKQSLEIIESLPQVGSELPIAGTLAWLGLCEYKQERWLIGLEYYRKSNAMLQAYYRHNYSADSKRYGSIMSMRDAPIFVPLLKLLSRLSGLGVSLSAAHLDEALKLVQRLNVGTTEHSLAEMSERVLLSRSSDITLIRERQDLLASARMLSDAWLHQQSHSPSSSTRSLQQELERAHERIGLIEGMLAREMPAYLHFKTLEPLSMVDVQSALESKEALIVTFSTPANEPLPEESFVWVVTKTNARWVRSRLGSKSLIDKVGALRCGLVEEEWGDLSSQKRCSRLLRIEAPGSTSPLPYHLDLAHELFRELFDGVEDLIKDTRRLLIVPSGPLTGLPFHALVTEKPGAGLPKKFDGYRDVAWLGKRFAISILPSVASLRALRGQTGSSPAVKPYIGFGDPVLTGDSSCRVDKAPDHCPGAEPFGSRSGEHLDGLAVSGRATVRGRSARRSGDLDAMFAKGVNRETILANVRNLCPLPDTAFEVRCVAERLGAGSAVRLDSAATEADIKKLSKEKVLANYRVVHFATHGLVAGDVERMAARKGEPALVLTPPKSPTDKDDDGLLTASEIAQLELNADWVVMSACNTAAAEKPGAEALSGLARAFFYAGARSLLVSHWPVYSDAAVQLTTRAFRAMDEKKGIGRAEALQIAMNELIDDTSQPDNAHPAVWAPFMLVGEGGARQ